MTIVLRIIAILVVGWISLAAGAQQSTPATGGLNLASTEGLRYGKLTFWVSSQWPSDPIWKSLVVELNRDYPELQVKWQVFERDAFLPALNKALDNHQVPDVVFTDNYAQEGPLVQRRAGRIMAGVPRHKERGWWMILNAAPDRKVAEAFFIWLEQPKDWEPTQPATQLLTTADEAKVVSIARETIGAFGVLRDSLRRMHWTRPSHPLLGTGFGKFIRHRTRDRTTRRQWSS
jgi:hypothetical protein